MGQAGSLTRYSFSAKALRKHVLQMAFAGGSVHIPCAFSIVEILSTLFSGFLRLNPEDPRDPERDYLVLSKGHGVMALYACFRELGWRSQADLERYFSDGSALRGLCESDVPGIETTAGSLGHGFPVAAGIALGLKRRGSAQQVYCIAGDGEMNEGTMWETILFSAHHRLSNLTLIIDNNEFQAMGRTAEVMGLEPWRGKFESFGWAFRECDGHDPAALTRSLRELGEAKDRPRALVARTVKGKGISFMEGDNTWHYTRLSDETLKRALKELSE